MSEPNPKSKPILIVDDDRDIRSTVAEILQEEGYLVETAPNGAVALTQLRDGLGPSVVLLDLMMPVMDGWAFCDQWRTDPKIASIPVVIISADVDTEKQAARCGANGYLKKPIQLVDLLNAVKTYAI